MKLIINASKSWQLSKQTLKILFANFINFIKEPLNHEGHEIFVSVWI